MREGSRMNPQLAAVQLDTIPCEVNFNVHKAGYRCERGVQGSGTGPRVIQVGDLHRLPHLRRWQPAR